ncbi:MAG: hypothetical protein U1E46_18110 [Hyphomicrobiales bacterium]
MAQLKSGGERLRREIDALKAEIATLKGKGQAAAGAAEALLEEAAPGVLDHLGREAKDLAEIVTQMIEDAEHTVKEHPGATIAGAIAIGIIIGRLTAR